MEDNVVALQAVETLSCFFEKNSLLENKRLCELMGALISDVMNIIVQAFTATGESKLIGVIGTI